jgi:hypothetical protein
LIAKIENFYHSSQQFLAKMSVFPLAHNLTNGFSTEKDYIQPFTVMAEEPSFRESGTPSPAQKSVPRA